MEENTNVQAEVEQGTTPDTEENGTQQADNENLDTAAASQEQQSDESAAARAEDGGADESSAENVNTENSMPFMTVRYNHEDRALTRDEAVILAQKGMNYEKLHGKLDYVASLQGIDVNTLVERLVTAPEEAHKKHLEELYGEDSEDVKIGMNIFREKQSENYKKYVTDRENAAKEKADNEEKTLQSRLADEYIELKREIVDAPEYAALPDEVIREAASGKRDLYSAYLRYLHKQKTKIDAAKQSQDAAAKASAGSFEGQSEQMSSEEQQFLAGLWGK